MMMTGSLDAAIENHLLLPLLTVLSEVSMSARLDSVQVKRLSYELIKLPTKLSLCRCGRGHYAIIDRAFKLIIKRVLEHLSQILNHLMVSEESFRVLSAANEPFKKTRRRLPPRAESELSDWLQAHSKHPYMTDEDIEEFCDRYDGSIESDQIRIFLTNARRKMSEGVRKRSKLS
jgi:hypothetical protein